MPAGEIRIGVRLRYEELAAPVEGELRREPISDADVPCPRCGGRSWLLIERRAEPERPFTRWRALACGGCGAADGWESAGRRRSRPSGAPDVPRLPPRPTLEDVRRAASFPLLAPVDDPELRGCRHSGPTLTAVLEALARSLLRRGRRDLGRDLDIAPCEGGGR